MSEAAKRMRQTHDVTGDRWFLTAAEEIERMEQALTEIECHRNATPSIKLMARVARTPVIAIEQKAKD